MSDGHEPRGRGQAAGYDGACRQPLGKCPVWEQKAGVRLRRGTFRSTFPRTTVRFLPDGSGTVCCFYRQI